MLEILPIKRFLPLLLLVSTCVPTLAFASVPETTGPGTDPILATSAGDTDDCEEISAAGIEAFGTTVLAPFSEIPYFGNSDNYTYFVNTSGTDGATVEDWMVIDMAGNPALALTNGDVDPTHPSGDPFYNPDEDLYSNGQFSGPGARAVVADTSFADFEMTVEMMRPEDQTSDFYDLAILFGYADEDNFHYANFGVHPSEATATIVDISEGEGMRTPSDTRFTNILPVFPSDDAYHTVLLRREGEQIALFIDGAPVMFTSDATFTQEGSVGVGSWNDNGIFDDLDVTALSGEYDSKMSFIVSSGTGTLTFDSLYAVPSNMTAGDLLADLTLSAGATAMVQDAGGTAVANDATLAVGSRIVVTAEAGNTKTYGVSLGDPIDDTLIEAVFSPVTFNDDSTELVTIDGTNVGLLLSKVRQPATATEQVVDDNGDPVTDMDMLLTEDMEYQVTGGGGNTRNYPINLEAPTYPTANISTADGIVIDEFFTDWENVEPRFDIATSSTAESLSDTMPSEDDISGYFKLAYDETYLYLYFNVTDDILNTAPEEAYQKDGIEIALVMPTSVDGRSSYNLFFDQDNQPGNQKFTYVWGADWSSTLANSGVGLLNKSTTLFDGGVVVGYPKEDGTGYEVEMQIPWSGLNQNDNEVSDEAVTPAMGEQFSMNVALNDNDGEDTRSSIKYWAASNTNSGGIDFGVITIGATTSTRNQLANFNLDVFPNPVKNQLEVRTTEIIEDITLLSVTGQVMSRTKLNTVDVSAIKPGAYLLRIRTAGNQTQVVRFIKQ